MRLVYLDEAGISNLAQEPCLVVAGVVVNPDQQWKDIETYFRDLAADLFPDEDPYRFVFHAHEIFHGNKDFDRKLWPRKKRMKVLSQLAQVPLLFDLPIVVGAIDRKEARRHLKDRHPNISEKRVRQDTYVMAFVAAIRRLQYWMEKNAPEEVALLIAEDTPHVRGAIRLVHEGYTYDEPDNDETFRAPNVIDTVHFAKKSESLLLQLADHCAFIVKRRLMGKSDVDEVCKLLAPHIQTKSTPTKGIGIHVPLKNLRLVSRST